MKVKSIVLLAAALFIIPLSSAWSITLVRVGYIDIDAVVKTYTLRYLDAEIMMRENYIQLLRDTYNNEYYDMSSTERMDLDREIDDQRDVLSTLTYSSYLYKNTGTIRNPLIKKIVQRDIMDAIKKTSELDGYSLVLDNSGNFVYGSEDINLTEKVLFRLDERLLDMQNYKPLAPLDLELESIPLEAISYDE
jgi:Skp family chaperone for outer membrane proteins